MSTTTRNNRYQEGSIERVKRLKGPDVWVYRWRELQPDGRRTQRKTVVGDVGRYKTKSHVKKVVENLRLEINAQRPSIGTMTISELWGHYQEKELRNSRADRSPVTIQTYLDNFRLYVLPQWGQTYIDEIRAVDVEEWLDSLMKSDRPKGRARKPSSKAEASISVSKAKPVPLAPKTKSKLRNQLSCLYSHAIRHGLWKGENPIKTVRQSTDGLRTPDTLTLAEMSALIGELTNTLHRVAILIAASTGLRRSEIRGLQWCDVDFGNLWLHLRRGIVRKMQTKLKTKGSRRGVPLPPDLAEVLKAWRDQTPYRAEDDWVLASPATNGRTSIWLDMVVQDHIKPAAKRLGINKQIGMHTFRHSLANLLASKKEPIKVTQELLRHSNSRVTLDVYQQADTDAMRAAQEHTKPLFLVRKAS